MRLLLAIPSGDFMPVQFVKSLTGLERKLDRDGVNYEECIVDGTLVYMARDKLASKAVNDGFSHVLWLDSDMVFSPNLLEDLMMCKKSFVSCCYNGRRPGYHSCIFKSIDLIKGVERFEEYPREPFRIAACGFGAVFMETEILRAVMLNFKTAFTPETNLGEDIAFCKRARDLGFEIWAEPNCQLGHVGHLVLYPQDHDKWKQEMLEAVNGRA
ncbi:MAG: hypothetical protein IIW12_03625 [Oscillospiraceae bacterium]|nr:hypothetical protein [Oscillospiraceae bacterium]